MSARFIHKAARIFPYLYRRVPVPGQGSMDLVFLSAPLPHYNPIGAGTQNARQVGTSPISNMPRLVGVVGPSGYAAGQVYNPPLINSGVY